MRGRKAVRSAQLATVGYVRVSSSDQAQLGVSLDAQEARIAAYAAAMGWELSEIVCDAGESAKSLKRPGISKILVGVSGRTIGRVIILKLDRLTRSMRDLSNLLEVFAKADTSLVSVSESLDTQTAGGRLVVNMLGVVAEWERLAIGERTSLALAHKRRSQIVYCGKVPFGFRRQGKKLIPVLSQQRALAEVRAMYAAGASLRQIAAKLEALGVEPNNGGAKWYAQSVKQILTSRMTADSCHSLAIT